MKKTLLHSPILLTFILFAVSLRLASAEDITVLTPARGGGLETNQPMVHIAVVYQPDLNKLAATVDTSYARPKLRPLPEGYAFDQDSLYRVISGKAYNFQYAWNNGAIFAPPPGAAIWIECLASTPGLETYDGPGNKTENPPRPYTPIFGTAGSPRIWKWYGRMAHNTYALRNPTTNVITAEYRLFMGDAQTGSRENFASYPETTVTLTWDIDPPLFVTPFLSGAQAEGDMVHIDITYNEAEGKLAAHVNDNAPTPELRPLVPGQAFDPTQKFQVLNQKHYNSQYGWNVNGYFTLPPGSAIWVEQVGASPGLDVYEENGMGGSYAPLFGTLDSPTRWKWSGAMIHNTYAVLNPCRNRYVAEYRLYLGDAVTGSREGFAGFEEAEVRLVWNAAPSAFPPALKVDNLSAANDFLGAWFHGEFGYAYYLECCKALPTSNQWERVAGPLPGTNGVQQIQHRPSTNPAAFYRLVSEPSF